MINKTGLGGGMQAGLLCLVLTGFCMSACATTPKRAYLTPGPGLLPASHSQAILDQSSCENLASITHYLPKDPDTGGVAEAASYKIPAQERIARVLDMGYVFPDHSEYTDLPEAQYVAMGQPACGQPDTYQYDVTVFGGGSSRIGQLYAQHTAHERTAQNCKPKYTQIYRPPTKLGDAGSVVSVKAGKVCK